MPTTEEHKKALAKAGIQKLVTRLKQDFSALGFDTSDAPNPISVANGELGFTCALPGVRFVVSIRANKTAKLLVTEASSAWMNRLAIRPKDQKKAKVPYWQPAAGERRSVEEIVALLEKYRGMLSTNPVSAPTPRIISVEEIIHFARENHGRTFHTLSRKRPFRICWEDDQVVFHPQSGTPFYPNLECYVTLYNKTQSLKPSDYPKDLWCNSYFVSMVVALSSAASFHSTSDGVADDIETIAASLDTERAELIKCRLGQGKFRAALLKLRGKCYVTGITDPRLLRASHIKPWRDSTNAQRLDPHNGLLLTPLYDHLFDQGLISFTDDGEMLVASALSETTLTALNIQTKFKGSDLGPKTRAYLVHHRAKFQVR